MLKMIFVLMCFATALFADDKVLFISGSTREDSWNTKLITEAAKIAKEMQASVEIVNLKNYPMPFYDADLEQNEGMPVNAKRLRNLMIQSNVIVIATPNYNSSISAVLKNALDWASRSENGGSSRDAFKGKKFILMSGTLGKSAMKPLESLKMIVECIGGEVVMPLVVVPHVNQAFDANGILQNRQVRDDLKNSLMKVLSNFK